MDCLETKQIIQPNLNAIQIRQAAAILLTHSEAEADESKTKKKLKLQKKLNLYFDKNLSNVSKQLKSQNDFNQYRKMYFKRYNDDDYRY